MRSKILISVILLSLCSGCVFPLRITTSPAVKGIIVDGKTETPVSGAEVFVSNASFSLPTFRAAKGDDSRAS
jgi:hypothetical protein